MTNGGQTIEWSQIKELSKLTTDEWRVHQLPPEAINLNNLPKISVSDGDSNCAPASRLVIALPNTTCSNARKLVG